MRTFAKLSMIALLPILALCVFGLPLHAAPSPAHGAPLMGMAVNTLGNYDETFFAQEALIQLEKVMGLAGRVYRDYSPTPAAHGDTIQIRRPSSFTAQSAPSVDQPLATESVSIVLNRWEEVKFSLTDKDLSLTSDKIISDHIRPAAVALADAIDIDLAGLYKDIPWHSTLTGTPVLGDFSKLRKIMFDNKVPLRDPSKLHLMVGGAEELAILNALSASGNMPNQQDASLRDGSMGRIYGFDAWANQNVIAHTSGVGADSTGTIDGVNAIGTTTLVFSNVTAGITWVAGDSFSIAGDPQRYVFTANGTDADGSACSAQISPLKQATAGGEVITIFLGGAAKNQNLAFHTNAFALATAPLTDMGKTMGARIAVVSDPITGISLRSRMFYIGDTSTVKVALDVLYGVKTLDRNLAVRGDAA